MFGCVALSWNALPLELLEQPDLQRRVHERGGEREIQFLFRDRVRILPVWHEGQLRLVTWGTRRGQSRYLPCTGWTWLATVESGMWVNYGAQPIDIPATMGLENGVWYQIREGIRGLLVTDEAGVDRVYMICEPSTYYYRVMTRSDWMPVLINERF